MSQVKLSKARGFTLIELLVVIFIISLVTGVAMLSVGHNQNSRLENFANEFAETISLAQEKALLTPAVLGLLIEYQRYTYLTYDATLGEEKNPWLPLDDHLFNEKNIPNNVEVSVKTNTEQNERGKPQIVISSNGSLTPFVIYIGQQGERPRFMIQGDENGQLFKKRLS